MNKYKIILIVLLTFIGGASYSFAQTKGQIVTTDVTGVVADDLGMPLAGVLVTNTDKTVSITDAEGKFTINCRVKDYIAFEQIGYERSVAQVVDGRLKSTDVVMMRKGVMTADEMITTPFGQIQNSRSTGSVITISGEQLQKHPSGLVEEALTGLIPGLQVRQTGARPGLETFSLTYHGNNVFVLVDGMPMTQNIGLLEIDKVVFMRGASATAFMGEIGANGLLSITTKRGQEGPRQITVQAELSAGVPTSFTDMQNSYQYANTINQALVNDGLSPIYSQEALDAYQSHSDLIRYPDVDYRDEVYRDYITRQQYSAQVSGGDDNTKYFANFTYNGLEGMENSPNRRHSDDFTFRSNLDIQVTDYFDIDLGLMGAYTDQTSPQYGSGSTMSQVHSIPSNAFPLMLGDSIYITSQQYGKNLRYEMQEAGYISKTDRVMGMNIGMNYDLSQITEGLSIKVRGTADAWNQSELTLNSDGDEYELIFDETVDGTDTMLINQVAWADPAFEPSSSGTSVRRQYNASALLAYTRTFGSHALDASFLSYYYRYDSDSNNKNRFLSQNYNLRANYTNNDKYTAELILNYAGTNKFVGDNNYKLFPTIGAAWVLSEEEMLKDSSVDFMKLRASWGQQGYLTSFSNYYSFLDKWSTGSVNTGVSNGSTNSTSPSSTIYKSQTNSAGLDWPVKTTINVGLDGALFNNAITFQVDYFHNSYSDLITRGNTLDLMGGSAYYAYTNQNQVDGNAYEIAANYNKRVGDFYYSVGANLGYYKAVRTEYTEPFYTNEGDLREGSSTDAIFGLVADGLFASDAEADASSQNLGSIQAGDIRYTDVNGDVVVDARDIEQIGNSDPRIAYGVNINLVYKAFSLYAHGAGLAGYDINLDGESQYQFSGYNNKPTYYADDLPNGNAQPRLSTLSSANNTKTSSYWLTSGNFFRLENVELAYNLPNEYAERWFVKTAKVFVRGKNLLMISKFSESDPEYLDGGFGDYPLFTEYSAGVKFTF